MRKIFRAIGLMSGTSMDGIDIAMMETDGEGKIKRGNGRSISYPADFRNRLVQALDDAEEIKNPADRPGILGQVERELSWRHADAVNDFIKDRHMVKKDIGLIGFHGHTVLHRPENHLTVQLGFGDLLARYTGIETVYDFRTRDIEEGGQGAPLVPPYHQALVQKSGLELPVAVVNIGGVANVTYLGADGELLAFDTGPGNALIDNWVWINTGKPMDVDGRIAQKGEPVEQVLSDLLDHSYFSIEPPKSLDRNDFSLDPVKGTGLEDGARTLTAFTALSIAKATSYFPSPPKSWIITGGGANNPVLMLELEKYLEGDVMRADDLGWSSTLMEAEAFAYLAVRAKRELPITFPATTGVGAPLTGCRIATP